jgi:hypothetical protein
MKGDNFIRFLRELMGFRHNDTYMNKRVDIRDLDNIVLEVLV